MSIIKQDTYICTDIDRNHYKYWKIYLLDDNTVRTEWGRVGYTTGTKDFPHSSLGAAETFYSKKCHEKERPHKDKEPYVKSKVIDEVNGKVTINNAPTGKQNIKSVINYSSPETERLINYLSQVNVHNILDVCGSKMEYDVNQGIFKTPLGIVTQEAIDEARLHLNKINHYVTHNDYLNKEFKTAAAQYLALIPQKIKTGKIDLTTIFYPSALPIQSQTLENLEASLLLLNTKTVDSTQNSGTVANFAAKVEPLIDKVEVERIRKKYFDTLNRNHTCSHLKPKNYFKIEISSMNEAFQNYGANLNNIMELWHGSTESNVLSIICKGFYIPPRGSSYVTGRLFGDGGYFAIQSTKSLGYSYGYWSGKQTNSYFMFLADVALGKYHIPYYQQKEIPTGYNSFWAKPGQSGIMNDEIIVPRTDQIKPLYLIEFE